jgi:F-type H+-transporting ATPase subunit b
MLIDWFTVAAQALNFLILVWLLKRFLYKPILRAMDAREQRIAAQLREAEAQKAEARKEGEELRAAREEFERTKQARFKEVTDEVNTLRQQSTEKARVEVENLRAKWREAVRSDEKTLLRDLADRVQRETFAIAGKILDDLAGKKIEQQVVDVFLHRLHSLGDSEKKQMATLIGGSRSPVLVRSAFDLPVPARAEIEKTVRAEFATDNRVEFENAAELIGGIELIGNGHKISWSVGDYLSSLEESVRDAIGRSSPGNDAAE